MLISFLGSSDVNGRSDLPRKWHGVRTRSCHHPIYSLKKKVIDQRNNNEYDGHNGYDLVAILCQVKGCLRRTIIRGRREEYGQ